MSAPLLEAQTTGTLAGLPEPGKSHSWERPTSMDRPPIRHRISVAAGSRLTTRGWDMMDKASNERRPGHPIGSENSATIGWGRDGL